MNNLLVMLDQDLHPFEISCIGSFHQKCIGVIVSQPINLENVDYFRARAETF